MWTTNDLTVSKQPLCIFLVRSVRCYIDSLPIYLSSLSKLTENVPIVKNLSGMSSVVCFYLTFVMEYHFIALDVVIWDVFFMFNRWLTIKTNRYL